jgi:transcriptional regulator with XRE-family HTH domain
MAKMPRHKRIGGLPDVIRQMRTELGLTQSDFATLLGVTLASVYRYESGKTIPKPAALQSLASQAVHTNNAKALSLILQTLGISGRDSETDGNPPEKFGFEVPPLIIIDSLDLGRPVATSLRVEARWPKELLIQAITCVQLRLWDSCILMSRHVIEAIADPTPGSGRVNGAREGLEELSKSGVIGADLVEWGKSILDISDRACQPQGKSSPEDARDILRFAGWLWAQVYALPSDMAEFRHRRRHLS